MSAEEVLRPGQGGCQCDALYQRPETSSPTAWPTGSPTRSRRRLQERHLLLDLRLSLLALLDLRRQLGLPLLIPLHLQMQATMEIVSMIPIGGLPDGMVIWSCAPKSVRIAAIRARDKAKVTIRG